MYRAVRVTAIHLLLLCVQFSQAEAAQLAGVEGSLAEFRALVRDIVRTAC